MAMSSGVRLFSLTGKGAFRTAVNANSNSVKAVASFSTQTVLKQGGGNNIIIVRFLPQLNVIDRRICPRKPVQRPMQTLARDD